MYFIIKDFKNRNSIYRVFEDESNAVKYCDKINTHEPGRFKVFGANNICPTEKPFVFEKTKPKSLSF